MPRVRRRRRARGARTRERERGVVERTAGDVFGVLGDETFERVLEDAVAKRGRGETVREVRAGRGVGTGPRGRERDESETDGGARGE
tara:strand:+ start:980 stop:1240 length:261 start_codon:yes stop_codon:yes gene_type:complete